MFLFARLFLICSYFFEVPSPKTGPSSLGEAVLVASKVGKITYFDLPVMYLCTQYDSGFLSPHKSTQASIQLMI